ncbi:MAG: ribosome silencing factor [Phycisphaerales bacterium]
MTPDPRQDPTADALHLTDRPKPAPAGTEREQVVRAFNIQAARLLNDLHCEQIVLFDVRGLSDLTDYILIATGTSDRQIKGVAGQVSDLAEEHGLERFGSERDADSTWLVLDFIDTIVHLFEPAARAHYDLEMLWGDAPKVAWRRVGGADPA